MYPLFQREASERRGQPVLRTHNQSALRRRCLFEDRTTNPPSLMKNSPTPIVAAVFLAVTLSPTTQILGQTSRVVETITTTTSEGTIAELGPQGVSIRTTTSEQPLRYVSIEATRYIDENGNAVEVSTIRSGVPVQVYYTKVGDTLIASKVLVRRTTTPSRGAAPGMTQVVPAPPVVGSTEVTVVPAPDRLDPGLGTTTTTFGTVTGFGPDSLIVQSDTSPRPIPHFVTKKTTFVDEAGTTIFADSIRNGAAVTVYSNVEAGKFFASRVVLKKPTLVNPPVSAPTVIERRTTTTTTEQKKED